MSEDRELDGGTNVEEKKPINSVEGTGGGGGGGRPGEGQQAMEVRQPRGSRRRGCYLSRTQGIIVTIVVLAIIVLLGVVVALLAATRCSCERSEETLLPRATTPRPTLDPSLPWSDIRLPRSLLPSFYDLELTVDVDNFNFSGRVTIDMDCNQATHYVIVHVNALELDHSQISLKDLSHPKQKVPSIVRHHHVPLNQFHVLRLSSSLQRGHKYQLTVNYFRGLIEDDLRGLYKSMYKDKSGQTR